MKRNADHMSELRVRAIDVVTGQQREWTIVQPIGEGLPDSARLGFDRDLWVIPGLVDAHCHIGLSSDGAVDRSTAEQQAVSERRAGVLVARDAGVPSDTRWMDDRDDLPRVIRCGRHIARAKRYLRHLPVEVEPDELPAEVARQAAAGDGWVKVVGDWIDRDLSASQGGDLAPLWPAGVVKAAVEAAHAAGARITTHIFGEQAVADWVAAGADCIEHGTGITAEVAAQMSTQGTVLDPTLAQIENFPDFAAQGESKFPRYAAHMLDLHARRFETVATCLDAGVEIVAGSDAGGIRPHGTIADEIELLARVGGAEFALGAASWRARAWLGVDDGTSPGSRANLVLLAADPRLDLTVMRRPVAVVVNGEIIDASGSPTPR